MADKRKLTGLLLGAALAGLAVGGIGVYVTTGGNVHAALGCPMSEELKKTLASLRKGDLAGLLPAEEPVDLTPVTFTGPDGKPMTIADFAGKAVLLNLWATWCVPCRAEMPALDRLQAAKGSDKFAVVTVNLDTGDPAKPTAFLKEIGSTALTDYRDPKMAVFNQLKSAGLALGLPTSLLVDAKGCQRAVLHGPAEWDSPQGQAVVDAMTAGM